MCMNNWYTILVQYWLVKFTQFSVAVGMQNALINKAVKAIPPLLVNIIGENRIDSQGLLYVLATWELKSQRVCEERREVRYLLWL